MVLRAEIHETAIVHPGAVISDGCSIGPYSVIGEHVRLGEGCQVASHVVIDGHTSIGAHSRIFPFAALGCEPQDLKFRGEPSELIIGEHNIIREYVTLQGGTAHGTMKTTIGSRNLFMAHSHVGHDCRVGDNNWLANSVALSGHVTIGNNVILGGMVGVHQFVEVGDYSFLGAGAMVAQHVPPYCMVQGDRAKLIGINKIGLKRAGFSPEEIRRVIRIYKALFLGPGVFADRLTRARTEAGDSERALRMVEFVGRDRDRGIASARRGSDEGLSED